MLIYLFQYLIKCSYTSNIFYSLTFRAINGLLTAFIITLWIGPYLISYFKKLQIYQIIRNKGPKSHFNKRGTPTMGGILMLFSIIISIILWAQLNNPYIWYILITLLGYAFIGFIDDYRKIKYKDSKGLNTSWKYFWQSIFTLLIIIILYNIDKNIIITKLNIPFLHDIILPSSLYYILLDYFVIIGTSNAVNLTDGLDGLITVPSIFILLFFTLTSFIMKNINFISYFKIIYIPHATELAVISMIIIGANLGFLWFNSYPAQIFMGDVGSLALGSVLGMIAILLHKEFFLLIIGGIFVFETLSVIIQVISYKICGQKCFLMAPIHHHYELKGFTEPKIIIRFWIISFILTIIGIITLWVY